MADILRQVAASGEPLPRDDNQPPGLDSVPAEILETILMYAALSSATGVEDYETVLTTLARVKSEWSDVVNQPLFRRSFLQRLFVVDPFHRYSSTGHVTKLCLGDLTENFENIFGSLGVLDDELFVLNSKRSDGCFDVFDARKLNPGPGPRQSAIAIEPSRRLVIERFPDNSYVCKTNVCKFNTCLYVEIEAIIGGPAGPYPRILRASARDGRLLAAWKVGARSDQVSSMAVSDLTGRVIVTLDDNESVLLDYDPMGNLVRQIQLPGRPVDCFYGSPFPTVDGYLIVYTMKKGGVRIDKMRVDRYNQKVVESITTCTDGNEIKNYVIDGSECVICVATDGNDLLTFKSDSYVEVIDADLRRRRRITLTGKFQPHSHTCNVTLDKSRGRLMMRTGLDGDGIIFIDLYRDAGHCDVGEAVKDTEGPEQHARVVASEG